MDRLHSMSRFAEPEVPVKRVVCDQCGQILCEGDFAITLDGDYLCSTDCLITFIGADTEIL